MPDKNLTIENTGGGVINIFYDGAPPVAPIEQPVSTTKESNKDLAVVKIAAMDKYSSPLEAQIILSPWGDMSRVSLLVTNELIGQVIQQNYMVYASKDKARDDFKKIVVLMNEYKDRAEKELIHSMVLSSQMRRDMMNFKGDMTPPESDDLYLRYQNPESMTALETGIPPGLLTYDHNHFPMHNGIVREASKNKTDFFKTAQNVEGLWKDEDRSNKDFIRMFCQLMFKEPEDSHSMSVIKKASLVNIRPLLSNFQKKSDEWLGLWMEANSDRVQAAIDSSYALALQKIADLKAPENIELKNYDLFLFDADFTLWDSDVSGGDTVPPSVIGRSPVTSAVRSI